MRKRPLCFAAVLFLLFSAIFLMRRVQTKNAFSSLLETTLEDGQEVELRGKVKRRETRNDQNIYEIKQIQIYDQNQILTESGLIVYVKTDDLSYPLKNTVKQREISVGNQVRVRGNLSFFQPATNPGNFDQRFYYQKKGIHAAVWAKEIQVIDEGENVLLESLTRFREKGSQLLKDQMGVRYGRYMSAILFGERSGLDPADRQLYQRAGIGHILAISGLHMSFLGMGLYRLLRKMGLSFGAAGGLGIVALSLYTLMIGSVVSAQRALIMFSVRVGADMTGREYDFPTSLSLAAALVILRQPLYLMDAGFLFSFGAMMGIAVLNPILTRDTFLPGWLSVSFSISLTLLPLMLYFYYEMPPYAIFLNLWVIPLMPVLLGCGILGSLLSLFWTLGGKGILQICKGILWLFQIACQESLRLPGGSLILGQPPKWMIVGYYLLFFGSCTAIWLFKERKKWIKTGLYMGIMIGAASFCILTVSSHGATGELQVTMVDVGQGDCLYLRTPTGEHCLVDGGSSNVSFVGLYRMIPFLKSQGVATLDYVFVSHGDLDHINGIQEILENPIYGIQIRTLVLPEILDESLMRLAGEAGENGCRVVTMREGEAIQEVVEKTGEPFSLTCLAPEPDLDLQAGNETSMVLLLSYGHFEMLFTGDTEELGEERLEQHPALSDIDVLKVAHHGSKNSTFEPFLDKTKPEIALISAGRKNPYGHPHEETLDRLEQAGCQIYGTPDRGAITVWTDGYEMSVTPYLN